MSDTIKIGRKPNSVTAGNLRFPAKMQRKGIDRFDALGR